MPLRRSKTPSTYEIFEAAYYSDTSLDEIFDAVFSAVEDSRQRASRPGFSHRDWAEVKSSYIPPNKDAIVRELIPKNGVVELVPLGDLHIGNKSTDYNLMKALFKYILETDGCYTIFLGDELECATKRSIGLGVYDEHMHLDAQIEFACEIMKPLAEAGKILGIHEGNHSIRAAQAVDLWPSKIIARELKVPYLGYQAYHILKVGSETYTVFTTHGKGSASTPGAKVNAAQAGNKVANCELYISGHTHYPSVTKDVIHEIDPSTMKVVQKLRYYVACGGFVSYFGGYTEMGLLPPTALGTIDILLYADRHQISVVV